jgi:hypothetical protein
MEPVEVELYEHVANFAVLRLPTRRFPGVLVQGDSLSVLYSQARAVRAALDTGDFDQAREAVQDLVEDLEVRLRAYIDVLDRAGIRLPFTRPVFQEQPNK